MKKIFIIPLICLAMISCSTDKKTQLEKLKKEYTELADKIKVLEKEIAAEGGVKTEKSTEVSTIEIELTSFDHYLEVQGRIDGDENVAVSPKTIGVITSIDVKEGEAVKKGQVLAHLDDAVMKKSIAELDSTLTYATNLYNKQKNLWNQKIGSEVQYLTAKNTKESLESKKKTLKEQLDMYKIVSPINGTIEDIPVKIGQSAAPGIPAFRVVNLNKVKVVSDVAETYSAKLKTGYKVKIYFPDLDKEIDAKITFASKYINTINRTFVVESKLDNPSDEYRANMIAVVKINDYHADSVIVIPVNALQKIDGKEYVYLNAGGKATKTLVTTGKSYNGYTEILSGLKKGDKLISVGYQNLEDGEMISSK